eukprot:3065719-Lingulodinium_polyedra.AAC.1
MSTATQPDLATHVSFPELISHLDLAIVPTYGHARVRVRPYERVRIHSSRNVRARVVCGRTLTRVD